MNLIGTTGPIVKSEENLIKNDCPTNCDMNHCDKCPFRVYNSNKK